MIVILLKCFQMLMSAHLILMCVSVRPAAPTLKEGLAVSVRLVILVMEEVTEMDAQVSIGVH